MRQALAILILIGIYFLAKYGVEQMIQYRNSREPPAQPAQTQPSAPDASLPGLPPELEPSLAEARQGGMKGLQRWLARYRNDVRDPRLASIELDYALLLSNENPQQAKRIFDNVKSRTPPSSPLYPRIKALEKTYD